MHRFTWILLLVLPQSAVAGPGQPPDTGHVGDDLFVAGPELVRLQRKETAIVWRSLPGLQTFDPVISGNLVLTGSSRGLYALDRGNGGIRWRVAATTVLYPPAVTTRHAYVAGQDGSLRAVGLADGGIRWQRRFAGWLYPPAIAGDLLVTGGSARKLFGIDRHSGETRWTVALGNEPVYRPVAIDQHTVVVTLFDGSVHTLDTQRGHTRWQMEDHAVSLPPVMAGKQLYFAGLDGVLRVRAAATGELIWSHRLPTPLSEPVIADGVVVVAAADRIIALNAVYGGVTWERPAPFILAGKPRISGDKLILVSRDYRLAAWTLHDKPILAH